MLDSVVAPALELRTATVAVCCAVIAGLVLDALSDDFILSVTGTGGCEVDEVVDSESSLGSQKNIFKI